MKRLALLLAARTIQAGPCSDGTDPGPSGCCADTGLCPPCTAIPGYTQTANGDITCTCPGQAGDVAHINATCANPAGCRALISDAVPFSTMSCTICAGSETCWPTVAAMEACQDVFRTAPAMSRDADGKVACTPRVVDAAAASTLHAIAALAIALFFIIVSQ